MKKSFLSKIGLDKDIKTPEQVAESVKKELNKYGLQPVEKVTVTDPLTGVSREISLDRTGYSENNLIVALADPNMNRDKKDFMISMYLYERGKESASFLVDLMRYKGEHTKETRAFKSQMRYDFEIFVSQFSKYIREQARLIGLTLDIDIDKERSNFKAWLSLPENKEKGYTYIDWVDSRCDPDRNLKKRDETGLINSLRIRSALVEMAINGLEEGERLVVQIQNVAKAREREKGKGIYIDRKGIPYTYDDPDLDEVIKKDREREEELNQE